MFGRKRLVDNIISEIKDKIIQGELKDGDMLASQDELAKTMGVSRASLREALNRLELMGLIESKQGRGTFVRTVAHTDFMEPLTTFLAMDRESALDLLEARGYIEGAMAALAANNAGEEDIEKLGQVLVQMEEACGSEDLKRFVTMDVQFHMLVAEFSKNQVMARIGEIIRDLLHQLIRKVFDTAATSVSDLMKHTITLHRNVYDAIRSRDAQSARRHMEFHISDVKDLILKSQNW
jgi:GntR family transcriptional repressor for pyruvate dehydrogenase complex